EHDARRGRRGFRLRPARRHDARSRRRLRLGARDDDASWAGLGLLAVGRHGNPRGRRGGARGKRGGEPALRAGSNPRPGRRVHARAGWEKIRPAHGRTNHLSPARTNTAAMNPSSGSVPASNIEIRFERGAQLPARAWCADRPRALVAIVHGLGEHGGRYAALASDLVRARFTVVALDLPGHGEAPGPRGDMASWTAVRDRIVPLLF